MSRRNQAEQMFNDMIETLKEKQSELDKAIADYTSKTPSKPFMDVMEDNEKITIIVDLPGVEKEAIKVDIIENNKLKIQADFKEEIVEEGASFYRKERRYGMIERILNLPAEVQPENVAAKFDNGVLTVILPKVEQETITVELE